MKDATRGGRVWATLAAVAIAGGMMLAMGAPQAMGAAVGRGSGQGKARLEIVPGSDVTTGCSSYPCATASVGSAGVHISVSLGIESEQNIQPRTYYTDLLHVVNPTGANVTITAVAVVGLTESRQGDVGGITVYYCLTQSDDPEEGCAWSFSTSSTSGGTVFSGADTLAAGATRYIELSGFAGPLAQPGDVVGFSIVVTAR
ncbi:MAG: hypothetical protein JRM85_08360 [Nitrososphaerota archaeon]|nr:hypothetical protein [Nitrososphaerota archaeon]